MKKYLKIIEDYSGVIAIYKKDGNRYKRIKCFNKNGCYSEDYNGSEKLIELLYPHVIKFEDGKWSGEIGCAYIRLNLLDGYKIEEISEEKVFLLML